MIVSLKKFDWVLLALVLAIMILGLLSFYGGSRTAQLVQKQLFFILSGLAMMFLISSFDYRIFKNYSAPSVAFYVIAVLLLWAALAFPPIRGSRSWITLAGYGFQPSELAKLAILILLAKYFSQKHVEIYRAHHIFASGIYAALPAALVLIEPDFGSMMVFVALWLGMLFFSGIKRKHLLMILMVGIVALSFAWFLAFKPYQKARVIAFVNPYLDPRGIGYSAIQAQMTFGSGRILGTFFSRATQKPAVLVPEQYTDFAFAAYGQRFGLIGIVVLVGLLLALLLRIGSIVSAAKNNFAKLYGLGLMTIIAVHSFLNAGMNMGILPITGIPFSFLSYGGSHLLTLMIGLGLVESIKIRG